MTDTATASNPDHNAVATVDAANVPSIEPGPTDVQPLDDSSAGHDTADDAADDDTDDGQEVPAAVARVRREAAAHRVAARDAKERAEAAETATASALAQLDALRRQVIESKLAEASMLYPSDAWTLPGVDPADVVDDSGQVDQQALANLVGQIRSSRPGWFAKRHWPSIDQGPRGDSTNLTPPKTWSDILASAPGGSMPSVIRRGRVTGPDPDSERRSGPLAGPNDGPPVRATPPTRSSRTPAS